MTALLQLSYGSNLLSLSPLGLIFCLIGDVCLALPQRKAFTGGLAAFLVGMFFYIFAFSSLVPIFIGFGGVANYFCCQCNYFFWLRRHLGSMLMPVSLYILAITSWHPSLGIFWKSPYQMSEGHSSWSVPLFLFFGSLCRQEQIHERTIPKCSRLAIVLQRAILAGLLHRLFKVIGRLTPCALSHYN